MRYSTPKTYFLMTKESKVIQSNIETLERAQSLQSSLMPNCPVCIMYVNIKRKFQCVGAYLPKSAA